MSVGALGASGAQELNEHRSLIVKNLSIMYQLAQLSLIVSVGCRHITLYFTLTNFPMEKTLSKLK